MYQLTPNPLIVYDVAKNAYIPVDSLNADYIAYLAWLDAGNTALPSE